MTRHPELLQESISTLRKEVTGNAQIKTAVYEMINPAEAPDHPLVEWQDSLTADENQCWPVLMPVTLSLRLQFCKIGYQRYKVKSLLA